MKGYLNFYKINAVIFFALIWNLNSNVSSATSKANTQLLMELMKNEEGRDDKAIDSSEWVVGTVTIEEAELYRKNYEEYLKNTDGNSEVNKMSFQLSDKMLRVIKRQKRDAERGQTGIIIVIGAKNPNATVENLNIIYMVYPVDKD
ncbi:MAG: hypothetical protein KDC90_19195, partial [Ignavibacteriae bacterium]|nr:hypothetical protein [Ignavibacteriota bacterium]